MSVPDPRICRTNFISWIGGQGVEVGLAVGEAKARITRTAMIAITASRANLTVGYRVFILIDVFGSALLDQQA